MSWFKRKKENTDQIVIDELMTLARSQKAELDNYRNMPKSEHYTTLKVPNAENLNSYLAKLGRDEYMPFYLLTLENDIFSKFVSGTGDEVYRGGLRVVQKIRADIRAAMADEEVKAKNAKV